MKRILWNKILIPVESWSWCIYIWFSHYFLTHLTISCKILGNFLSSEIWYVHENQHSEGLLLDLEQCSDVLVLCVRNPHFFGKISLSSFFIKKKTLKKHIGWIVFDQSTQKKFWVKILIFVEVIFIFSWEIGFLDLHGK